VPGLAHLCAPKRGKSDVRVRQAACYPGAAGDDDAAKGRTSKVEHDLTGTFPRAVRTRFELAVRRMMDTWLSDGRVKVSPTDVQLAREFLEDSGCKVEDAPNARVRLVNDEGRTQEMSREATVMVALRRLAAL